jgi:hypothetical protein
LSRRYEFCSRVCASARSGCSFAERNLRAPYIQLSDCPGDEALLLRLQLVLHYAERFFLHADLGAIQQQLVIGDAQIERDPIRDRSQLQLAHFLVQSRDHITRPDRAAAVDILHDAERRVVIVAAQSRFFGIFAFPQQPGGKHGRQHTRARFHPATPSRLHLLSRDRDFRVLLLRERHRFLERQRLRGTAMHGAANESDQHYKDRRAEPHRNISAPTIRLGNKNSPLLLQPGLSRRATRTIPVCAGRSQPKAKKLPGVTVRERLHSAAARVLRR